MHPPFPPWCGLTGRHVEPSWVMQRGMQRILLGGFNPAPPSPRKRGWYKNDSSSKHMKTNFQVNGQHIINNIYLENGWWQLPHSEKHLCCTIYKHMYLYILLIIITVIINYNLLVHILSWVMMAFPLANWSWLNSLLQVAGRRQWPSKSSNHIWSRHTKDHLTHPKPRYSNLASWKPLPVESRETILCGMVWILRFQER